MKLRTSQKLKELEESADKDHGLTQVVQSQERRPRTRGDPTTEGLGPSDEADLVNQGDLETPQKEVREGDKNESAASKQSSTKHGRNSFNGRRMTQD